MSFDLGSSSHGFLLFPTTGVRSGTKSIAFNNMDYIKLYSEDRHILNMHLKVHLAWRLGKRGHMELSFEHVWPDGCMDFSQLDCSDTIPDDEFPWFPACGWFPFIARDNPVTLKLQIEGNFLVVRGGGNKFMGKVSLPPKNCDLSQERQKVTGASQEGPGFTRLFPRVCI